MPNRFVCLVIIVSWLAAMTWFVRREIVPQFVSDAPPAFVIDFSDEAVRHPLPVRWTLSRNGRRLSAVQTVTNHIESDDTFKLTSIIWKFELFRLGDQTVTVEPFRSHYHITRKGELIGLENEVQVTLGTDRMNVLIAADVKDGMAYPRCRVESPWGQLEPKLEPIAIASGGQLNPMHPVNRVTGLRLGQRWQVPMMDPLVDVQRATLEAVARSYVGNAIPKLSVADRQSLTAEVTGPRTLEWNNREQECFVIEYRGNGLAGKTWVRVTDGWVLRQEAISGADEIVLQRE